MPPRRKIGGGNAQPVALMGLREDIDKYVPTRSDKVLELVSFISAVHREIHEGCTYDVSFKNPDDTPIADNGTIIFLLTTTTKQAHLIFAGAAGGDAELEYSEDVAFTGGTPMTPRNVNRHTQDPDGGVTVAVVRDPTITNEGVRMLNKFLPGGIGGNAPGAAGVGTRNERVLDVGRNYMIRLTNRASTAQPMSLEAEWYEEDAQVVV